MKTIKDCTIRYTDYCDMQGCTILGECQRLKMEGHPGIKPEYEHPAVISGRDHRPWEKIAEIFKSVRFWR